MRPDGRTVGHRVGMAHDRLTQKASLHFAVVSPLFLLVPAARVYLRILCASILRFWLLEHTTATRSGWLGIATLRLRLTDTHTHGVRS